MVPARPLKFVLSMVPLQRMVLFPVVDESTVVENSLLRREEQVFSAVKDNCLR